MDNSISCTKMKSSVLGSPPAGSPNEAAGTSERSSDDRDGTDQLSVNDIDSTSPTRPLTDITNESARMGQGTFCDNTTANHEHVHVDRLRLMEQHQRSNEMQGKLRHRAPPPSLKPKPRNGTRRGDSTNIRAGYVHRKKPRNPRSESYKRHKGKRVVIEEENADYINVTNGPDLSSLQDQPAASFPGVETVEIPLSHHELLLDSITRLKACHQEDTNEIAMLRDQCQEYSNENATLRARFQEQIEELEVLRGLTRGGNDSHRSVQSSDPELD